MPPGSVKVPVVGKVYKNIETKNKVIVKSVTERAVKFVPTTAPHYEREISLERWTEYFEAV